MIFFTSIFQQKHHLIGMSQTAFHKIMTMYGNFLTNIHVLRNIAWGPILSFFKIRPMHNGKIQDLGRLAYMSCEQLFP